MKKCLKCGWEFTAAAQRGLKRLVRKYGQRRPIYHFCGQCKTGHTLDGGAWRLLKLAETFALEVECADAMEAIRQTVHEPGSHVIVQE